MVAIGAAVQLYLARKRWSAANVIRRLLLRLELQGGASGFIQQDSALLRRVQGRHDVTWLTSTIWLKLKPEGAVRGKSRVGEL